MPLQVSMTNAAVAATAWIADGLSDANILRGNPACQEIVRTALTESCLAGIRLGLSMAEEIASKNKSKRPLTPRKNHPRTCFETAAKAYAARLREHESSRRKRIRLLALGAKTMIFLAQDEISRGHGRSSVAPDDGADLAKARSLLEAFDTKIRKGEH